MSGFDRTRSNHRRSQIDPNLPVAIIWPTDRCTLRIQPIDATDWLNR